MLIQCLGSRGSAPISGEKFLRYGGSTTCVCVTSSAGDIVLFDAGTGIRNFDSGDAIAQNKTLHLLFTHYHLDHIIGFPFFKAVHNQNAKFNIYGPKSCAGNCKDTLHKIMRSPYFPVDLEKVLSQITFGDVGTSAFSIGSLTVTPIPLSHPDGGCGYRIDENGKSFVFITDNELQYDSPDFDTKRFEKFCEGADLLIHDGEYTDAEYLKYKTWGHSRYTDAIKLALASNVKRLGIFHLNGLRTDDQMDAIVADAKNIIAQNNSQIEIFGVGSSFKISI